MGRGAGGGGVTAEDAPWRGVAGRREGGGPAAPCRPESGKRTGLYLFPDPAVTLGVRTLHALTVY